MLVVFSYLLTAEPDVTRLNPSQRGVMLSQVWLKMARLARASGLLNLARLALERLLETRMDHVLALRMLREVLSEIGDVAACREVSRDTLSPPPMVPFE